MEGITCRLAPPVVKYKLGTSRVGPLMRLLDSPICQSVQHWSGRQNTNTRTVCSQRQGCVMLTWSRRMRRRHVGQCKQRWASKHHPGCTCALSLPTNLDEPSAPWLRNSLRKEWILGVPQTSSRVHTCTCALSLAANLESIGREWILGVPHCADARGVPEIG